MNNHKFIIRNTLPPKLIYLLLVVCAIFVRDSGFQDIILITACFVLNYYLIKKFDITDRKLYFISIVIIAINVLFIYISYYNAIHLGFSDGLLLGRVGNNYYNDEWGYYYQSKLVSKFWLDGKFISYFTGGIDKYTVAIVTDKQPMVRGLYNYYILWNSALIILFGDNLNSLIIFKYQFSIIAIYMLYKISIKMVDKKYARVVVLLMNLFPGYLTITTTLMRDNIVFSLILVVSNLIINSKDNKKSKKVVWFQFILLIALITYIRFYIGIILGMCLLLYHLKEEFNIKRVIMIIIMIMIIIIVVGKITELLGFGFLGSRVLFNKEQIDAARFEARKAGSPIKLLFWSLYALFTGGRSSLSIIYLRSFQEIITTISPIFISYFILPTIFVICVNKCNKTDDNFILFSFLYSIFSGIIVYYYFTGIIPRLYICWIWSQLILFVYLVQQISKLKNNLRYIAFSTYVVYLIFIIVGFTR